MAAPQEDLVRRAFAAIALLWAGALWAADSRVFTDAQYSSDSDDQVQRIFSAGFRQDLPSLKWETALGRRELSAPAGRGIEDFSDFTAAN